MNEDWFRDGVIYQIHVRAFADSNGDGTGDFKQIFTKLANYDFDGWAVLEWECAYKDNQVGAAEGAKFIAEHIIPVTETSFDDFASGGADDATNRRILGIDR